MRRLIPVLLLLCTTIACGDIHTTAVRYVPPPRSEPAYPTPHGPGLLTPLAEAMVAPSRWYAAVAWFTEAERAAARTQQPRRAATRSHTTTRASVSEPSSGRCGGDLPSCAIMQCESGGDPTIVNHNAIRPAGKWQITTGTWGGYGGYSTADQAPESVQDERARQIWAGGRGRGQWAC